MKLSDIKNEYTLNIFTDGSMSHNVGSKNIPVGCSGAVIVDHNENTNYYTHIIENCTNNIAELMAIYLGIDMVLRNYNYTMYKINLFSDSLVSINSLKDWIYNWKQNKRGLYINSSGKPVANQDIITRIVSLICNSNLAITFYHQKGHIDYRSLSKGVMTFKKTNNIKDYVDMDVIKYISSYNEFIDNRTRCELINYQIQDNTLQLPYVLLLTDEMKNKLQNKTNAKQTQNQPYYYVGDDEI